MFLINHLESIVMEILGFIVVALVVYNLYFFYNVMFVLPKRGQLFMKLPFYGKAWVIRSMDLGYQPVVQYTDTTEESVEDEPDEDDEPEELEGSLADDEIDLAFKQPRFHTEQIRTEEFELEYTRSELEREYMRGANDGRIEGMKDGRQEGYAEGFQNGCENSECGPLVADLVHELIDRKEFSMAAWLTTELDNMD